MPVPAPGLLGRVVGEYYNRHDSKLALISILSSKCTMQRNRGCTLGSISTT